MQRPLLILVALLGFLIAAFIAMTGPSSPASLPAPARAAVVVAIVVVMLIVFIIVRSRHNARHRPVRRNVQLEAAADQNGLTYLGKGEKALSNQFAFLPDFPTRGKIQHHFVGEIDRRSLTVFTHMYMVHTGQTVIPVAHTVYALAVGDWPEIVIKPRGALFALRRLFGAKDGVLLDDPEFNKSFHVRTEDEGFAIALLTLDMQRFLLTKKRNINWRVANGWLCLVYNGPLKPDRIGASMERMHEFWRLTPDPIQAIAPVAPLGAHEEAPYADY